MLMRLIPSLETRITNYFLMISFSVTLSSLSLTQIMYNNIYKQIEKSEDKKKSVPIH